MTTQEQKQMKKEDAQKIEEALALLNEAAQDKKHELGEMISSKYDDLKQTIQGLEDDVTDKAKQGAEHLGEFKHVATEQVKDTAHRVDEKVHADPWKVLGWAVAGAFTVGFLLGRKD